VETLDRRTDVVWCHTQSRHIDAAGKLLVPGESGVISYVLPQPGQTNGAVTPPTRSDDRPSRRFQAVLLGRGGCLDVYALMRSEVVRRTPLLLPHFGSEKVFIAELALRGRYAEIPETLFFARIHPQAAGNLRSARQQRSFINPQCRRRQFPRLRLLAGYCDAVRRAPLPPAERARSCAVIVRYLLQVNKWKSVIQKAWGGVGMAGEYPTLPPLPAEEAGQECAEELVESEPSSPKSAATLPQVSKP
jgi:hypothetical protein